MKPYTVNLNYPIDDLKQMMLDIQHFFKTGVIGPG